MKIPFLLSAFFLLTLSSSDAPAVSQVSSPATHDWIEREWDIRYFISVDASLTFFGKSKELLLKKKGAPPLPTPFLDVIPQETITEVETEADVGDSFSKATIIFDQQGWVTSNHVYTDRLRGRINRLRYLVLSAGDQLGAEQFAIAHWFHGFHEASEAWAPAFCGTLINEIPGPFSSTDKHYRYGNKFDRTLGLGNFGCREWAYQLYDQNRPYIDVTSYEKQTSDAPHGTYVRDFIGWGRFGDNKPIIGKHGKAWICFHDCPEGELPGVIPDIHKWVTKRGWPLPRPPKKQPLFPDADFKH